MTTTTQPMALTELLRRDIEALLTALASAERDAEEDGEAAQINGRQWARILEKRDALVQSYVLAKTAGKAGAAR